MLWLVNVVQNSALFSTADMKRATAGDAKPAGKPDLTTIAVVTPVLDDWISLEHLLGHMDALQIEPPVQFHVIVIDDGSLMPSDLPKLSRHMTQAVTGIDIVPLAANMGHQRAIAIGLCLAAQLEICTATLVLDSDGEDSPANIPALVAAWRSDPTCIIMAQRTKRSEGRAFRLGYRVYRAMFQLLIGVSIDFGNFALLPQSAVRRIIYQSDLWNNFAGSVIRSRLQYRTVPTVRGRRYAGTSKMNTVGLVTHGLSAMSVLSDRIFTRMLLAATALAAVLILAAFVAVVLRLTTDLYVPGWTSLAIGLIVTFLSQTAFMVVVVALSSFRDRANPSVVPAIDHGKFILRRPGVHPEAT